MTATRTPLRRTSGASATSDAVVREATSSAGAAASRVGLLAAASLEEAGGTGPAGGTYHGHAQPVAAGALGWASAVELALRCLINLGTPVLLADLW
ncbi:hypothetical protein NDU88_006589 [Pleurodeles waltl]|uniref:Uncharacterized protein n=1 Tax=Pleurodeles waltl TaxID=8319 RepID=A0AAV7ULF6_PLEWA|nr:hypothetical protein NDU88_006589 [Pleurodeles waltl]